MILLHKQTCFDEFKTVQGHYDGAESDEIGFNSSSGIPELRIGMTRSSISGKTSFFCA